VRRSGSRRKEQLWRTDADDSCNVDCFVITDRPIRSGQIVDCEPIVLMEQIEDGKADHNVLARPGGEHGEVTDGVEAALIAHAHSKPR
jgi:inorganic pyrophosphatase